MVLCLYFLQGSCRFGTKCINEHFDVRQIIKSEVEAALKGSQWPLSCFGPFKEKPSLENFITDQSFEEIRYLCWESKKQNTFSSYAQQLNQQILNAQNKMKVLLTLSREVVEVVVNLYNSNSSNAADTNQSQSQPTPAANNNPFAVFSSSTAANNNSKSLFGTAPAQSNPFANSSFGSSGVQTSAGGIFGGAQATVFGGGQSAFGGTTNNAFGGAPKPSVFGGGVGTQQQPQQSVNAFSLPQLGGQPNTTANAFGATQTTSFGAPAAFGPAPAAPNIFGQQMQPSGIFAQQSQSQNFSFVQAAQSGQSNAFSVAPAVQQQSTNIFGQSPASNFGMAQQQPNAFGQPPQQQFQQNNQQQQAGFGAQATSVFGTQPTQHQQNSAMQSTDIFGGVAGQAVNDFQQNSAAQPFGAAGGAAMTAVQESAYSKMENLTPEALEAFKATDFVFGKLPIEPPPRDLCI